MLHSTPTATGTLQRQLDRLDGIHAELAHEIDRAAPWDGTLRRDARAASVVSSTSIEGYSVDPLDARAIVDGAHPAPDDDDNRWAVACYARAMDHVRVMSDDPVFAWDHRVVLDLHFDACLFQPKRSPGRYRSTPIHVSAPKGDWVYHAPDADRVVDLMGEASTWLQTQDLQAHVAVRAAMAHLHIISIHPFRDGNGRISRIAHALVLARAGVLAPEFASIEPYLAANTSEYYLALQQAQGPTYDPTRDATAWVEFCIEAHIEQALDFQRRMREIARRWNALEQIAAGRGWPERMVIAMEHALTGGLARGAYAVEADVSAPTATNDLRRLGDAGLVEQRGGGRSTTYVATQQLHDLLASFD